MRSDPAVYPHFDLYPAKPLPADLTQEVDVHLKPTYPTFSICKAFKRTFYTLFLANQTLVQIRLSTLPLMSTLLL